MNRRRDCRGRTGGNGMDSLITPRWLYPHVPPLLNGSLSASHLSGNTRPEHKRVPLEVIGISGHLPVKVACAGKYGIISDKQEHKPRVSARFRRPILSPAILLEKTVKGVLLISFISTLPAVTQNLNSACPITLKKEA